MYRFVWCVSQILPHLIGMQYNSHNVRLAYKVSLQHGTTTKAGNQPHFNHDYSTFQAYWNNLTNTVLVDSGDHEAAQHMLELGRKVSTWMTLALSARQHEIDEAWLVAAHRILDRLDRACHHGDLAQLSVASDDEEQHAKIRATSISAGQPKPATQSGGGAATGYQQRGFKRPRSSVPPGSLYCDYHKYCSHVTADCTVLKKTKGSNAGTAGK